jgi:hypothetical protein
VLTPAESANHIDKRKFNRPAPPPSDSRPLLERSFGSTEIDVADKQYDPCSFLPGKTDPNAGVFVRQCQVTW